MRIPNKVKIGGIEYDVEYVKGLNNGVSLAYGHIDYDKTLIEIAQDVQSKQGECVTLLHEILHGVSKFFDLQIESDEDTIDKLAKGLYMVIKDNPAMFQSE